MSESLKQHILTIGNQIEDLAKFCKRSLPDSMKRTYVEFLLPLTPEEVTSAFKTWAFKSTSFPSPEELLECCGRSPKQRAERQWVTLDMERDRIADEVCRREKILVTLSTLSATSEYASGLARRDLQKRFVEEYRSEWLRWWTRGEIANGETTMDFRPKPKPIEPIAEDQRLKPEDLQRLKEKINALTQSMSGKAERKFLSPEEIANLEQPDPPPAPPLPPTDPDDDDIEWDIAF